VRRQVKENQRETVGGTPHAGCAVLLLLLLLLLLMEPQMWACGKT
jgi:hypothetical protein